MEKRVLSEGEVRILLALASGPLSGYALAQKVEEDALGGKPSNGTVYPALRRLERLEAIQDLGLKPGGPGKGRRIWRLSRTGRLMLEWEVSALRRLVRLADNRL